MRTTNLARPTQDEFEAPFKSDATLTVGKPLPIGCVLATTSRTQPREFEASKNGVRPLKISQVTRGGAL